jgi:glycosyltransferase involved in cell wall biosynthesis
MRLLVVSHACVVDVNQRLYRDLERMGHSVTIVVPERWRHVYMPGDFPPARLSGFTGPLVPLPLWGAGSVPLHTYRTSIGSVVRGFAPQALYLDEEPYSVAAFQWTRVAATAGLPVMFFTAQNIPKRYPFPFRLSERYVCRHASAGLCATEAVARALRSRGYHGRTFILPYPVDIADFRPRPAAVELRGELHLRRRVVAYLGRLVPEKGIRVLLDAYQKLRERRDTSLLFLGSGPLAQECAAVEGAVVVERLPHSGVPKYLALADLTVLPSLTTPRWKEQFGRAAVEAMACGLPVIGSDSGAIPEVIEEGGVIVAEGDSNALARAIEALLVNPDERARLGQRGWQRVRDHYSTGSVAGRLATILGSVTSASQRIATN